jgi:hypothetical protein
MSLDSKFKVCKLTGPFKQEWIQTEKSEKIVILRAAEAEDIYKIFQGKRRGPGFFFADNITYDFIN